MSTTLLTWGRPKRVIAKYSNRKRPKKQTKVSESNRCSFVPSKTLIKKAIRKTTVSSKKQQTKARRRLSTGGTARKRTRKKCVKRPQTPTGRQRLPKSRKPLVARSLATDLALNADQSEPETTAEIASAPQSPTHTTHARARSLVVGCSPQARRRRPSRLRLSQKQSDNHPRSQRSVDQEERRWQKARRQKKVRKLLQDIESRKSEIQTLQLRVESELRELDDRTQYLRIQMQQDVVCAALSCV